MLDLGKNLFSVIGRDVWPEWCDRPFLFISQYTLESNNNVGEIEWPIRKIIIDILDKSIFKSENQKMNEYSPLNEFMSFINVFSL